VSVPTVTPTRDQAPPKKKQSLVGLVRHVGRKGISRKQREEEIRLAKLQLRWYLWTRDAGAKLAEWDQQYQLRAHWRLFQAKAALARETAQLHP
jgi:hypothetical protein